jgi:hypothetical protein
MTFGRAPERAAPFVKSSTTYLHTSTPSHDNGKDILERQPVKVLWTGCRPLPYFTALFRKYFSLARKYRKKKATMT